MKANFPNADTEYPFQSLCTPIATASRPQTTDNPRLFVLLVLSTIS